MKFLQIVKVSVILKLEDGIDAEGNMQYVDLSIGNLSNDKNVIFSFNYAKPSATAAQVKALMNSIITNGSIFSAVPATAVSATQVTTAESEYDLSD